MGDLMTLPEFLVRSWQVPEDEIPMREMLLQIRQKSARHLIVLCDHSLLDNLLQAVREL